jgi:hypothetical protein
MKREDFVNSDIVRKLKEYKALLDTGALTQTEFEQLKNKLLFDDSEMNASIKGATQPPLEGGKNVIASISQETKLQSQTVTSLRSNSKSLTQSTVKVRSKKNNWVIPAVIGGVIIIGGGGYFAATHLLGDHPTTEVKRSSEARTSNKSSSSTKTKSSSNKNKASMADNTQKSDATPGWSSAKLAKLSGLMSQWENTMGQQYQGTYDNQVVDRLGYTFPDMIQNGKLEGKITLNGTVTDVVWDADGKSSGDYQAVAFASGIISGQMYPTSYLFVIDHGNPVVYVTQTTNGDVLYFTPTENNDLQSGFEDIVSGQSATVTTVK